MSNYTNNTALPILTNGQAGAEILIDQAWGILDNVGINASTLSVSLTGLSTYSLTVANQTTGNPGTITTGFITFTGSPSGGVVIQLPLQVGSSTVYVARSGIVVNNTTAQTLTVQADSSKAKVTIGPSGISVIACDGENVYNVSGGNSFSDGTWIMQNSSDNTKKFQWNASNITTGTVRTYTMPNANTNIMGNNTTDTVSNKTFDTAANLFAINGNNIFGVNGGGTHVVLDTSPQITGGDYHTSSNIGFGSSSTSYKMTATGTTQGTGTASFPCNVLQIIGGGANTGIVLQPRSQNTYIVVGNQTASNKLIYPSSGRTINGGAANAPINLDPGDFVIFSEDIANSNWDIIGTSYKAYTPTISAGTGAGTSPTVTATGTDNQFQVSVITGSSPAGSNATIATITFGETFLNTPHPTLTPANANAAALTGTTQVFFDGASTNTATLVSGSTALTASTTYLWNVTL